MAEEIPLREKRFEINKSKVVGRGSFGIVFGGTFDCVEVAIKRIEKERASERECDALCRLNHPNVVKLLHTDYDEDFKYTNLCINVV